MFSTVLSATLRGLFVEFVQVEADTSNGLPMFHMVGYLSSEVKEAGERVRTAIKNSGVALPAKKIVINLSPANMRKKGSMFDLPIAIAILASLGEVEEVRLRDALLVGELSLDGAVKHVPGILPIVMEAKKRGCRVCIVPKENQKEGSLVDGIQVIGVENLAEVYEILKGKHSEGYRKKQENESWDIHFHETKLDYSDIHGQRIAKRAAEIAVAGNHNMLMIGPPGTGKSMIAKRIPTILPPLTKEESMELTMIYSVIGGLNQDSPLMRERPFREVHQSVTKTALIGGGTIPKPGEISLAHKGVLFLDEIAEFQKPVIELLRQPMEEHQIKILRERGEYLFPAEFLLVAAMNPCPCGNYPDLNKCMCTTPQIRNYLGRISQPFLDRIDICVEVEKIQYQDLQNEGEEETSQTIRERVSAAREIQRKRYQELGILTNSELKVKDVEKYCHLGVKEERMMRQAFERMNLTARMYYKVLAVARTIADLEGKENIELVHLAEALSYRSMDQKYWGGGEA
ncbi:MAG: YifB family Mg chelatase-like AAA ATPase [Tyzzerella sp.]|nr:YifB family Mg chelatase-like AAA ATPase [Tyzzerella sp.]